MLLRGNHVPRSSAATASARMVFAVSWARIIDRFAPFPRQKSPFDTDVKAVVIPFFALFGERSTPYAFSVVSGVIKALRSSLQTCRNFYLIIENDHTNQLSGGDFPTCLLFGFVKRSVFFAALACSHTSLPRRTRPYATNLPGPLNGQAHRLCPERFQVPTGRWRYACFATPRSVLFKNEFNATGDESSRSLPACDKRGMCSVSDRVD